MSIFSQSRPAIDLAANCLAITLAAASMPIIAGETCQHPGPASIAPGSNAFACGFANQVNGANSTAFGRGNEVSAASSTAFGHNNFIAQTASTATAIGITNFVTQSRSAAVGYINDVTGINSNAFGGALYRMSDGQLINGNYVLANQSNAFGLGNSTTGMRANGFGILNVASGRGSNAFGGAYDEGDEAGLVRNTASGTYSNAFGTGNQAEGASSTAVGFRNRTSGGRGNTAVGEGNIASGLESTAMGSGNEASSIRGVAIGSRNVVDGNSALAVGYGNAVSGTFANAVGAGNIASGEYSNAFGNAGRATGVGSLVVASWYDLDGNGQQSFDLDLDGDGIVESSSEFGIAIGTSAVAIGAGVRAVGDYSAAFGVNAVASVDYSVAIGYNAVADREYSISVGSPARMNQIANLADGTEATDAVNLRQMRAADDELGAGIAAWLGGGAAYAGGVFTAPVYVIQSNNYNNVGTAFGAVDAALTDINQRIVDAGGVQGERGLSAYEVAVRNGFAGTEADWLGSLQGPAGPGGPQGPEGPAGGGPRSVVYDNDGRDVLTLAGENGTTIGNVADGVAATDAANVRQVQAGDAATLASANTYTDTVAVQTLQSANDYTDSRFAAWDAQLDSIQRGIDDRFHQQDRRIDRQGAMSGAFAGMAMNTAGLSGQNRIGVGVGVQGGEQALAVGYQRAIGNRASVSLGGAFSGNEKSMMGGAGFSW
ncbi:hypothetical protein E2F46_02730 [Luteimonas aestuarii]|uniref:Adhesin n=1 Tax=Luteimonas aestuarii TaxID=453837 RepID=A0A4R5U0Q2_9GAMM|nr:YadA-like family protein [Luteimonas aestuarii]TDK27146.1 hypothetical protein E2F46_02730 [Luteimonas aestuarii]